MSSNPVTVLGTLFLLGFAFFGIFSALQGSPYEIPFAYLLLFELFVIGMGGACVYSLTNRK